MNLCKKTITLILAFIMCFGTTITVFAETVPVDISGAEITLSEDSIMETGAAITPQVTVKVNDVVLVLDTDYNIEYSNNIKAGTATVTVTGINNYTGTASKNFTITAKPVIPVVTAIKYKDRTTTSLSVTWNSLSNKGVNAYKVYTCKADGTGKKLKKTVKSNAVTLTGLKAGTRYNIVIKSVSGEYESNYSYIYSNVTRPNKVDLKYCSNSSKKAISPNWSKTTCSGYQIQYSQNKNFSNSKLINVNNPSTLSKSINIGSSKKKYYVRVRAYSTINGSNVYGDWSKVLNNQYTHLYSKYSTKYVNNKDRTTNLKIASKAINGKILAPGETFSFNKTVGKRTASKGYKKAHVFTGADTMTMGLGGGVCQVASTMFNAALLGNLKINERHQHSQRVAYVPLGRDAAIYYGSEDFKFTNNTNSPMQIKMTVKDGYITCALYTCEDVKHKKVTLKVTRKGNNFTLKRYVGKKCNYTTHSHY